MRILLQEDPDPPVSSGRCPSRIVRLPLAAETLPQLPISRLVVSQKHYQMITNLFHASAVDEDKNLA
ncbi:hypothetical protein VTP01DRAFT_5716 [Rhizomucor pusillus]|uniref:uncharacterized protein n=1 Tax=Rhizomucor pusillus TaxID=4840 RepID=UPI0037427453